MSRCLEIGMGGTGQGPDIGWGYLTDPCSFSPWQGRPIPNTTAAGHCGKNPAGTQVPSRALNQLSLRNGIVSSMPTFSLIRGSETFWTDDTHLPNRPQQALGWPLTAACAAGR